MDTNFLKGQITGSGWTPPRPPRPSHRQSLSTLQRVAAAFGIIGIGLIALAPVPGLIARAATLAASLDQCGNGALLQTLTPEPCVGSTAANITVSITGIDSGNADSYANWQNGDVQGQKAHWREGEFIAYRAELTGLTAGTHTLYFNYDSVHSSGHAIDYLGSYDATEKTTTTTTSANGTIIHANNNSPCADLVAAGDMPQAWCGTTYNSSHQQTAPATPVATGAIPPTNITAAAATDGTGGETDCGGSSGTFSGSQAAGTIDLFGPSGSTVGTISYITPPTTSKPSGPGQNIPSGGTACTTNVAVTFTVPSDVGISDSNDIVFAWGGHIASQDDWGTGNSAAFINGSPYHMALSQIDTTTIGSQDRALATSAIFFTPTISTTVVVNGTACTTGPTTPTNVCGPVTLGASVADSATLIDASAKAGGTVTYTLYRNTTCTAGTNNVNVIGTPEQVTVTNDVVPNSTAFTPAAGSYSYSATYSGDGVDIGPVTGVCEPFTVQTNKPSITTTAQPSTTGTVGTALTVGDQATVTGVDGLVPTGNGTTTGVTFTLVKSDCTTVAITASAPQALTSNGTDPASANASFSTSWTPQATGTYYWVASYTGDSNYSSNTSACPDSSELVTISAATPSIATTAQNTTSGTVGTALTVGDKSTVTGNDGVVPTGDGSTTGITFTLYRSDCSTAAIATSGLQAMTSNGSTPASASATYQTSWTPQATGTYYWVAHYTGDSNYSARTEACPNDAEKVTVSAATPSIATTAQHTTVSIVGVQITVGDSAVVTGNGSVVPTGNGTTTGVTFTLLEADCSTVAIAASSPQTLTSNGTTPASSTATFQTTWTPPATGTYYWVAHDTGDTNYTQRTSACPDDAEKVTIGTQTPPVATTAQNTTSGTVGTVLTVGDKATITGNDGVVPTGDGTTTGVTFTLYAAGCTTVILTPSGLRPMTSNNTDPSSASATYSTSWTPTTVGTFYWVATYTGDTNYNGATSACPDSAEKVTIAAATPPITTTAQPSTAGTVGVKMTVGDKATLTGNDGVALTGNGTTGVTFTLYASDCKTVILAASPPQKLTANNTTPVSATATYSTSWMPAAAGTYYWVATYTGDTNYTASTSKCPDSAEAVTVAAAPAAPAVQVLGVSVPATGAMAMLTAAVGAAFVLVGGLLAALATVRRRR